MNDTIIFGSSTNIKRAERNDEGYCVVTFVRGDRYGYKDVPEGKFWAWMSAPSAGKYFNTEIKGRFECQKLQGGNK